MMDHSALESFYWYHPKIEPTISHRDLHRIPLDNRRHSWLPLELIADLGLLGLLPNELLTEILIQIDLPTLTNFRRVNRIAMTILDAVPAYSFIVSRFPALLRAAILSNAQSWTCQDLHLQLGHPRGPRDKPQCTTTINDKSCKHPAAYLWLPTGKCLCNCCYHAQTPLDALEVFRHMSLCGLLPPSEARQWETREQLGRHLRNHSITSIISTLPHCNTLPGIFGRWKLGSEDEEDILAGHGSEGDARLPLALYDREAVHERYMPPERQWDKFHKLKCVCEWYFCYDRGDIYPELPMHDPSTSRQSLCAVRLGVAKNRDTEGWPPKRLPAMCRGLRMRDRIYVAWSGDVRSAHTLLEASVEENAEWE
ncbi:hypothetical protein QBC44DRAFT_397602 [Cladorrhinum sp. PSN332]|nr:hypothetical protein QBC44DRAFT_397602 [Cladorrhinum sp. PSN332]